MANKFQYIKYKIFVVKYEPIKVFKYTFTRRVQFHIILNESTYKYSRVTETVNPKCFLFLFFNQLLL